MSAPVVTVVIPTYNRPAQLEACLEGITKLDRALDDFEVVIVDDGSAASLEPSIAPWRDRLPLRLMVQARGGPAAARNAGAKVARGRFLAFIDDDCIPAPGWLSALVRELKQRPDCLLGGLVMNGLPDNPYATAAQRIATYVKQYYQNGGNECFFTTNNLALSAERFREIGGFDTSIPSATAEDKEFCDRWRTHMYEMACVPDAKVTHAHDLTLWSFLRQHFNYGRGILVFRLIQRRRGPSRLVPEPFPFYWNLILLPLRRPDRGRTWRNVSLMVTSQLAIVAGASWAALFDRPNT
jgi:glycosyltransferase involved in cell wall biosynthesis